MNAALPASDFPTASEADWLALVEKSLAGADFDKRLVSRTAEGLRIEPLYTRAAAAPPLFRAAHAPERPWDVRVRIAHPDPAEANRHALEALEGGAASLLIAVDPTGRNGVAAASAADLARVLDGVHVDLAPVALEADRWGADAAEWLCAVAAERTLRPRLQLHVDPLSAFAAGGFSPGPVHARLVEAARAGAAAGAETVFLASGMAAHEAGAGEAQELGVMAAAAVAYVRAGLEADLSPGAAFGAVALGLSADADYFLSLAKLRAARVIWVKLAAAILGAASPPPARIEVRSSRRTLSTLDPWVNMLRLTASAFAGAVGGADAVVLDTFVQPLCANGPSGPTAFARRQSRNIQLVLMEESHLGRVADPAAGAFYIETMTDQFARAGWAFFQRIEAEGGLAAALRSGMVADAVAETRAGRERAVATRKTPLLGVSEFADLASAGVEVEPLDPSRFAKSPPSTRPDGPEDACTPLAAWRAAAPFEALRARAGRLAAPRVYLATLGTPREHAARVGFARNLYAAGGLTAEVGPVEDYGHAVSPLAVLCGADAAYAEDGAAAVANLKTAGARSVILAGPSTSGLVTDGFVYAGCGAVAALDAALTLLETAP